MDKPTYISQIDMLSVFNSKQGTSSGASPFHFHFLKSGKKPSIKGVYPVMSWTNSATFIRVNLPNCTVSERKLASGTREITTKYETVVPEVVEIEAWGQNPSAALKAWNRQIAKVVKLFAPSKRFRCFPDLNKINVVFQSLPEFRKYDAFKFAVVCNLSMWRYFVPEHW